MLHAYLGYSIAGAETKPGKLIAALGAPLDLYKAAGPAFQGVQRLWLPARNQWQ